MVYKNIGELPDSVRNHLPVHAQEIYKDAFNNAWQQYADPKTRRGGARVWRKWLTRSPGQR